MKLHSAALDRKKKCIHKFPGDLTREATEEMMMIDTSGNEVSE